MLRFCFDPPTLPKFGHLDVNSLNVPYQINLPENPDRSKKLKKRLFVRGLVGHPTVYLF